MTEAAEQPFDENLSGSDLKIFRTETSAAVSWQYSIGLRVADAATADTFCDRGLERTILSTEVEKETGGESPG